MGKNSKTRVVIEKDVRELIIVEYFNTGLMRISRKDSNHVIIQIASISALKETGHVEKIVKLVENYVSQADSSGSLMGREVVLECPYISEDIVRWILDSAECNDLTKLATICGVLTMCPSITSEILEDIIKKQTPVTEANVEMSRFHYYLLPNYLTASKMKSNHSRVVQNLEQYMLLLSLSNFFALGEKGESYEAFVKRVPEGFRNLGTDNDEAVRYAWDKAVNSQRPFHKYLDMGLDSRSTMVFSKYYGNVNKEYWSFLTERLQTVDGIAFDSPTSKPDESIYARFLTPKELRNLTKDMKARDMSLFQGSVVSDRAVPIIVQYFIAGGIDLVQSFYRYVEKLPEDSRKFFINNSDDYYYGNNFDSVHLEGFAGRVEPKDFLNVINIDFQNLPYDWALQLAYSEHK